MRHRIGLVLLAAITNVGCSERTLSPDRAASLIGNLEQFKREARLTIRTGVPLQTAFRCESQADVERTPVNRFVVDRGWVRYETREAVLGFGTKSSCPAMALTPAGEAASAQWTRGPVASGEGTAWGIPLGRREFVAVTGFTTAPDESTRVEFEWKWTPNETGTALQQSASTAKALFQQTRQGRASCRRGDDGWGCQMGMWTTPADVGELRP